MRHFTINLILILIRDIYMCTQLHVNKHFCMKCEKTGRQLERERERERERREKAFLYFKLF